MIRYLCLSVLIACGTGPTAREAVPPPATEQGTGTTGSLALTVITAADNVTRLPAAEVFVIHVDGRVEPVGITDQFGRVQVQRGPFLDNDAPAIAVMVCHPVFYCGVLRTEEVATRTESTIALATRVIR